MISSKPFKFAYALFVLSFGLFLMSCSDPEPASPSLTSTTLILSTNYLNDCDDALGGATDLEIEVNVDGIDNNRNPIMMDTQFFGTNNNDNNNNNLQFPIKVPYSGTYAVSVNIRLGCHQCCESKCFPEEMGKPRFRGTSTTINGSPPPGGVRITPVLQACLCSC